MKNTLFALLCSISLSFADNAIESSGVKGGLVVHLGRGELRANDSFVVQNLDAGQFDGKHLPYVDNLVNLIVADKLGGVSMDEVMRVLVPNGVAIIGGKKTVKPRPSDIDEWTHFLHDAGNNAVARDTRVDAPRSLQWQAPPLWLRSHETPSGFQAMVCGGGRVFYIFDEGIVGITDQRLPERWVLLCRDAFNGKLLWRRSIERWGWPEWATNKFANTDWTTITGGRTVVPDENQRRLVVDGDRLYATLSYRAPLSILDATTGKTLATVANTVPVRQIIAADGVALIYSQDAAPEAEMPRQKKGKGKDKGNAKDGPPGALIAVEGATGKVLWRKPVPAVRGLSLAIDSSRIIYQGGASLAALELRSGKELWSVEPPVKNAQTVVAHNGVVLLRTANALAVHDGAGGRLLWQKEIQPSIGVGTQDLFVIDGVVWPGVVSVNEKKEPEHKGASVLATGYDLRTGAERKKVFASNLLSPEHHHRCYRNKATGRFIISAMEGSEYLDLQGTGHSQNNFVRGACRLGIMPANGMLYVPPDQCFCDPGAKMLGFSAIGPVTKIQPVPDNQRLQKGPAFGHVSRFTSHESDWPTFRHDAARHATTPSAVGATVNESWRVKLGAGLTQPVVAGGRVFAAARESHTIHALDLKTGKTAWTFVAGGRIDSPPTLVNGFAIFGSADGYVYCLRADDGALAWRFLAAPCERRIMVNDQVESVWPVHGSVLVSDGVAYATAGRSTYLDGGIRVYALDTATGKLLHQTTLSGPFPDGKTMREVSFYISGANSDVLASEGGYVYMRQKKLSPDLREEKQEDLSVKGEKDVGLHVFSTSGFLDGSWYNRAFWMYSKRWPGFQLANQSSKSGQLLIVDNERTYAVQPYYRRNVHTPMFFPAKEGYLLYADKNSNEPQIVGDPAGARKPVEWLPQSDYVRGSGRADEKLENTAFGLDKMIGYTRGEPPLWKTFLPVRIRAMVKAGDTLFVAGPPDELDTKDPYAAFDGKKGAKLVAVSAKDGKKLAECTLNVPPVFDGLIAASGRLLVALEDGSLACLEGKP